MQVAKSVLFLQEEQGMKRNVLQIVQGHIHYPLCVTPTASQHSLGFVDMKQILVMF